MTHITEALAIACLEREKEKENEHLNKIAIEAFDKTLSKLESRDGWVILDIPKISEEELLKEAEKNGIDDDNQTRRFIKFVTTASNFASAIFKDKLQYVPEIVQQIKDLIVEMKKEIKEFANIAAEFEVLIHLFVKIVMNTKHNLNMIKPNLQDSVLHFKVLEDASKSDILTNEDKKDCTKALTSLRDGINKLQERTKISKKESEELDIKIQELKKQSLEKKIIVDGRIEFAKIFPRCGLIAGTLGGIGLASLALDSAAFGGPGALVVGGFVFPSLGAILLASAVGGVATGGIVYLIKLLYDRHQIKALKFLEKILSHLNKLQNANTSFMDYMNKSEEKNNAILTDFESIQNNLINGSKRYRENCSGLCKKASESTESMIKMIDEIDTKIDITSWASSGIKTDDDSLVLARN